MHLALWSLLALFVISVGLMDGELDFFFVCKGVHTRTVMVIVEQHARSRESYRTRFLKGVDVGAISADLRAAWKVFHDRGKVMADYENKERFRRSGVSSFERLLVVLMYSPVC